MALPILSDVALIPSFICWLIDEKAYKAASEQYTVPIDKIRKIPGITESIVSLSKHTFTLSI
jgi:hypothetical protein